MMFLAIDAPIPWTGLLLAYGAGQLAATLPITPGGLGVVEGSITVALVAFGGAETSTAYAVLLYRIISFWFILVLGWLAHRRDGARGPAGTLARSALESVGRGGARGLRQSPAPALPGAAPPSRGRRQPETTQETVVREARPFPTEPALHVHVLRLRPRRRRFLPAVLLAGSLLAACSSARVTQGTSDEAATSPCRRPKTPSAHTRTRTSAGVRKFTVAGPEGPGAPHVRQGQGRPDRASRRCAWPPTRATSTRQT